MRYVEGPFYATEHAIVVTPKAGVNRRWIHHALEAMKLNQYASRSAQPGLSVEKLNNLQVQLPTAEEQRDSATTLDEIARVVNDLTLAITSERLARRQQYKHYRDHLLTFDEASVVP